MSRERSRVFRIAGFSAALAAAVGIVYVASAWQELPKVSYGMPTDASAWKAPTTPVADPPIGAILPYYGDPAALDGSGWVPCDGTPCPDWADERLKLFLRNRSPERPGCLPNLNDGRFLRGTGSLDELGRSGGTDAIRVDGEHSHDSGGRKLKRGGEDSTPEYHVYTAGAHDHGGDNRPPFVNVYYIMRLK